MGSWGKDTFDNDTAQDLVGDTVERLLNIARRDIKKIQRDNILERQFLPAISLIRTLAVEHPLIVHCSLDTDELKEWRVTYLTWLKGVDDFDSSTRNILKKSASKEFATLLRIAKRA